MNIAILLRGEPKMIDEAKSTWDLPWLYKDCDIKFFGSIPSYQGNVWDLKPRNDFNKIASTRKLTRYTVNNIKKVIEIINYFSNHVFKRDINELYTYKDKHDTGELYQLIRMLNQIMGSLLCKNLIASYAEETGWYPEYVIDTRYDLSIFPTGDLSLRQMIEKLNVYNELHKCKGSSILLDGTIIEKPNTYVPTMTYNYSNKNSIWFPDWLFIQEYNHKLYKQSSFETMKSQIDNHSKQFYDILNNGSRAHYAWHFFNPHTAYVQNNLGFETDLVRHDHWEKHLEINPTNAYTLPEDDYLDYVWRELSK